MSDQLVAETSTLKHTTLTTVGYPSPGGIRTRNPSKLAAADPRLRPRGHWDRQMNESSSYIRLAVLRDSFLPSSTVQEGKQHVNS